MARSKVKNVDVTPRTDNQRLDARYPTGNPGALDIVINNALLGLGFSLAAGAPFSQDMSVFVSGADEPGSVYTIVAVTGSLASLDLAMASPTLSGATPDTGTGSFRLKATNAGQEFLSDPFPITISPSATDTLAPAIPPPPVPTVISATRVDVTGQFSMDPVSATVGADGMQEMVLRRAVVTGGVEGSFSDRTSISSVVDGFTGLYQAASVGAPLGSPSITQSNASYTVSHGYGAAGGTADDLYYGYWAVSGDFVFTAKLSDFNGQGDSFSASMIMIRLDNTPGSPFIRLRRFTAASGKGISYVTRSQQNGTTSASAAVTVNIPTDAQVFIQKVGTTYTCYFLDTLGAMVQIGTPQTIAALTGTVRCCFTGFRPSAGTNVSCEIKDIIINTIGTWTFQDTTVAAGTTYAYRLKGKDDANNLSAESISTIFVATPTQPVIPTKKWEPSWIVFLNNFPDNATERAKHLAPTFNQSLDQGHIIETATMPNVGVIKLTCYWGTVEQGETLGAAVYTWDIIDQYVERCAQAGKKLMLSIFPCTYNTVTDAQAHSGRFFPRYISENPTTYGITKLLVPGYMARTWKPAVNARLIALHTAMAARYDNNPAFYGCQTEETAINVANGTDGYSYALYMTALFAQFAQMSTDFVKSQIRCSTNYFNGGIVSGQQIIAEAAEHGIGVGGPDVIPRELIDSNEIYTGYSGGIDYRGAGPYGAGIGGANVMPFYSEIQWDSLGSGKEGNYTIQQLYDHIMLGIGYASATPPPGPVIVIPGMAPMNCNHIVCYRNTTNLSPYRLMWYANLKPFINSHLGYGSSAYPTSQPS